MLMLGQPLHAFDLNTLPAREITVRAAKTGEHMTTLDGKDRALTERDMLITSGGEAIALAGVMGGEQTGINDDTTTIVIESACFSPIRVGHTSRRLGINSEAAFRFARTVDPALSKTALMAASTLMHDWCGADVSYSPLSAENDIPSPKTVTLSQKKLNTYLSWGSIAEAAAILEGFGIKHTGEGKFLPPTWRPDITIEEDLIEEVGRYRGYNDAEEKLPGEMPRRADVGEAMRLAGNVRSLLMARGFTEVVTYSCLPEDFPEKLRLSPEDERAKPRLIANPISREQTAMRTTLLPGLLMGLKASVASGWREPVRIFEQGRVFIADEEPEHVAGLIFNGVDARSSNNDRSEGFYDLKADVEALMIERCREVSFLAGNESFTHSGQAAKIIVDGTVIGWIGRLKPAIEQKLDVEGVYAFEVDLTALTEEKKPVFKPASAYPASYRDVSLLVPVSVSNAAVMSDIRNAVKAVAGESLRLSELRLFDIYAGSGIPEGFRSLAYTLSYRSDDRTLTVEEVEAVHVKVRSELNERGYSVR